MEGSVREIEERLGSRPTSFAYPYGDYSSRVVETVREQGFQAAVTTSPSVEVDLDRPLRLPRLPVLEWHSLGDVKRLAEDRNYLYRCYRPRAYHYLRHRFPL